MNNNELERLAESDAGEGRHGLYLLCSKEADGFLDDIEIERVLRLPLSLHEKCRLLYKLALRAGSDNSINIVMFSADEKQAA
jgi:hypothetical protein